MTTFDLLRRPLITEKSMLMQERGRYTFAVPLQATKHQIKWAVEEAFDVKVVKINTMRVHGQRKRYGPRVAVARSWKKAIVTLAPGQSITIFEGI